MRKLALRLINFLLLAVALLGAQVLLLVVVPRIAEATGPGKIEAVARQLLDKLLITTGGVYTAPQAADAQLADVAGLTPADNAVIIGNGTNFVAESGATLKTSLGLTIGTDVQAFDEELSDVAGLTPTSGAVIIGNGTAFVTAEAPFSALTTVEQATGATLTYSVPAGTLAADGDALYFVAGFVSDDTETLNLTLGGQSLMSGALAVGGHNMEGRIIRTSATTVTFYATVTTANAFALGATRVAATVTLADANDLVFSWAAQDAGDDFQMFRAWLERAP